MPVSRRTFLAHATAAVSVAAASCGGAGPSPEPAVEAASSNGNGWEGVRAQFALTDEYVHMSALLIAAHPKRVRDAIDRHRLELDRDPVGYLVENNGKLRAAALASAAAYVGGAPEEVALTDSTTMGLGLLYGGLRLEQGQEVLTTSNDYFATHEALRAASERCGSSIRQIDLYEHGEAVSADALVERVTSSIKPNTRAIAITWVSSGTGLKMPIAALAEALAVVNRGRDDKGRVLLCVDGVHGFGVEAASAKELGADFFAAGCHKWLFGPRGTGILWGRSDAWPWVMPTIPSFIDSGVWSAWIEDRDPKGPSTAARITPGGFKPFEHQWAIPEAFAFHDEIGRERVEARTHALSGQLKEGLAGMRHVRLITPRDEGLSAGIVCFDVQGMTPREVVRALKERRVVATTTPYATSHARLTPSIVNTEDEVDAALAAVRDLA